MPPVILAIDRNPRNAELLSQVLDRNGYRTLQASSLEEFDRWLERGEGIDLVLVDVAGFDQNIWGRCDRLRATRIPFLVISGPGVARIAEASVRHGACGTLFKPLAVAELLGLIRGLLEK